MVRPEDRKSIQNCWRITSRLRGCILIQPLQVGVVGSVVVASFASFAVFKFVLTVLFFLLLFLVVVSCCCFFLLADDAAQALVEGYVDMRMVGNSANHARNKKMITATPRQLEAIIRTLRFATRALMGV